MGCDGGTIPRRDELVKVRKKPEQKDRVSELSFLWQHCNVSQEPLKKPIVACGLGRLYNKDVIIEKLLDKSSIPESMSHIKALKDVKDLNLTPNPAFKEEMEKGDSQLDRQRAPYICPISGLEMNGKFKFCFFWTCGCVVSERGLKQFNEKICTTCQMPYTDIDVIILNATGEDLELMLARKEARQSKVKANKKLKNKVKLEIDDTVVNNKAETISNEKMKPSKGNESVASKETKKKNSEASSSVKANNKRLNEEVYDPAYKKTKSSYSVAKDPSASGVYKSLFTTHENAKNHSKAHWITCNPFYN